MRAGAMALTTNKVAPSGAGPLKQHPHPLLSTPVGGCPGAVVVSNSTYIHTHRLQVINQPITCITKTIEKVFMKVYGSSQGKSSSQLGNLPAKPVRHWHASEAPCRRVGRRLGHRRLSGYRRLAEGPIQKGVVPEGSPSGARARCAAAGSRHQFFR